MDSLDLARRAVACPKWRWKRRMLALDPKHGQEVTIIADSDRGGFRDVEYCGQVCRIPIDAWLPALTDPATLGCLLALVRKVHRAPYAYCWPNRKGDRWQVYRRTTSTHADPIGDGGDTEAEALVSALEAAHG